MARANLILGDCLEKMKEISDGSIKQICTDPPYNVLQKTQSEWDDHGDIEQFMSWTKKWMDECYRVAAENSAMYVFWGQKFMKEMFNLQTEWEYKRMLVWWHPNLAKPTRKIYLFTYDPIYYFVKGKPHFDASFAGSENVDVFNYCKPQSNWNDDDTKRFHPASKPVQLMKKLIKPTTKEGDVVLDPFMGGGATGVAALRLNREFIGIEKEQKYFDVAKKRIENWSTWGRLNEY